MTMTVSTVAERVSTSTAPSARWRRERLFFMLLPIAAAIAVFVGFAPTYYLKGAYGTPPLRPLYHIHGFLFSTWMALLIIQPALVAARRTDLHRRIGVFGAVLAGVMVPAALAVSIDLARRGAASPARTSGSW